MRGIRQRPEKAVEAQVLLWLKSRQFQAWVIDASTYVSSKSAGSPKYYKQSHAPVGHSDIAGICPGGRAFFCELKAPGKIGTLTQKQHNFLKNCIESNAFAVCVDSCERLSELWSRFNSIENLEKRKQFLIQSLKKKELIQIG